MTRTQEGEQPATRRRWKSVVAAAALLGIATAAATRTAAIPLPPATPVPAAPWTSAVPTALRVPVEYEIDPAHSRVGFKVRHLGISSVHGHFNRFAGRFAFDPADAAASWAEITIEAASIDTDNERRDNHLRSADFLEAERHPEITFTSRRVEPAGGATGEGRWRIEGDLTIRGVTLPVVLDAALQGQTTAGGRPVVAWTAETAIDRTDYGLTWNRAIESGGFLVGDEVQILLEIEARGPEPAAPAAG